MTLGGTVLLSCLAGCDGRTASASASAVGESPPAETTTPSDTATIDLSTPDRELRTYWALVHYRERVGESMAREYRAEAVRRLAKHWTREDRVVAGRAAEYVQRGRRNSASVRDYVMEREIESVRLETSSRAVVEARVRDVTTLRPYEEIFQGQDDIREPGVQYRYILELQGKEWRVVDVSSEDRYNKGRWSSYWQAKASDTTGYFPRVYP